MCLDMHLEQLAQKREDGDADPHAALQSTESGWRKVTDERVLGRRRVAGLLTSRYNVCGLSAAKCIGVRPSASVRPRPAEATTAIIWLLYHFSYYSILITIDSSCYNILVIIMY